MTGMLQLVVALHSFVGLVLVFIGINSDIMPPDRLVGAEKIIREGEIFVRVFQWRNCIDRVCHVAYMASFLEYQIVAPRHISRTQST